MFDPKEILAQLQAQAEEEETKNFGEGLNRDYITLDPGDSYTLRFLPPSDGLGNSLPWKEFYTHWIQTSAGNENVVCTQSYENPIEPCPFCQKAEALKDAGEDKAYSMSKAKQKVALYAINRFEEVKEGELPTLCIFEIPQWFFRDFRGLLIRDDGFVGMAPFDNESGYDIVVSRTGEGTNTKYFFDLRKTKSPEGIVSKKTPLFDSPELIEEFMAKVPKISKYKSIEFSPDEIQAMLELKTSQKELIKAYFAARAEESDNSDEVKAQPKKRSRR